MDIKLVERFDLSSDDIRSIEFIEESLGIEYKGYSTPHQFIRELYHSAVMRSCKSKIAVISKTKKRRSKNAKGKGKQSSKRKIWTEQKRFTG